MTIRHLCIGAVVLFLWGSGNLHAADTLHQSPTNESKKAADTLQRSSEKKKPEADSLKLAKEKKKKQEADSLKLVAKKKKKQKADSLKLAKKKEKQEADSLKRISREKKKQLTDSLKLSGGLREKQAADSLQISQEKEKQETDSLKLANENEKQPADSLKLAKEKKKQTADSLKLARKKEKQEADSLKRIAREKKKKLADSLALSGGLREKQAADSLQISQEKEKQETDSLKLANENKKLKADSLKLAKEKEKQTADSLKRVTREKKKQLADSLKLSRGLKDKQSTDTIDQSRVGDTPYQSPTVFSYTIPAATRGALRYSLEGSLYYGTNASLVTGLDGRSTITNLNDARPINPGAAKMVTGNLGVDVGVHRMVDLSVSLPLYVDIAGWGITKRTIGDLSVSGTFVPVPSSRPFRLGARLSVIAPTGNQENGLFPRHVYYIQTNPATAFDRGVTFARNKFYLHPSLIASYDMKKFIPWLPLEIHFNTGGIFSDAKERFTIDGALAFALRPVRPLTLSLELASETRPFVKGRSIVNGFFADPLRCIPAIAVNLPGGVKLLAAGELGLSNGSKSLRMNWHRGGYAYATKAVPFYGIAFSIVYMGTLPRLGILPEGAAPGGFSEEVAVNNDHDHDSIPDSLDNCPGTPEDHDGFSDTDGCPDYDNDNDGIADEVDGCPVTPEDIDRFEDGDGCPDIDNDKDGIDDSTDACPDEKGPEHNRGCPETGDLAFERTVLAAIAFEPGTSRIVSGTEILDRIFTAMQKAPTSTIEFQVHTDNRGSADSCRVLSQNRADVLKLYLVAKGIRPDRIKAVGLGSEFPVADNSTEAGRTKNRRVEVRRIE